MRGLVTALECGIADRSKNARSRERASLPDDAERAEADRMIEIVIAGGGGGGIRAERRRIARAERTRAFRRCRFGGKGED